MIKVLIKNEIKAKVLFRKNVFFVPFFTYILSLKTMLNCIETLKRNYKATLNVFLRKIFLVMTKVFIFMIDFLCKIEILLLSMLKIHGCFFKSLKFQIFCP